ncbi:hypothetical protein DRP04_15370 [Archaeoglobales archaeon]|nr:MAG: hypothetical protein DRP04_15370 [Archaeoglobales archaeon]
MRPTYSIMPYAGGDARFVNIIISLLPDGKLFCEPFGGSGVVSLTLASMNKYPRIILNDGDPAIYAVYYVLKYEPDIIRVVESFLLKAYKRGHEWLKNLKAFFKKKIEEIERGEIKNIKELGFITLLMHYLFTAPFRSGLPIRWIDKLTRYKYVAEKLEAVSKVIQKVEIRNEDAFELIPKVDSPETVFYVDPPHIGKRLYRMEFTKAQALRLGRLLAKCRGKILAKYSSTDRIVIDYLLKHGFKVIWSPEYISFIEPKKRKTTKYFFLANY